MLIDIDARLFPFESSSRAREMPLGHAYADYLHGCFA